MEKTWIKTIGYTSIIPLLIGLYFFDNIKGYYRFKELCGQEKRLVVTTKLERDVGWQVDLQKPTSRDDVLFKVGMPNIKFVRFQDSEDHKLYDAYYVGKTQRTPGDKAWSADWRNDYEILPASLENKTVYQLESFKEDLPMESRTNRYGYRIIDLRINQEVVTLSEFGYSTFERSRTLLDAPSGSVCHNIYPDDTPVYFLDSKVQNSIF